MGLFSHVGMKTLLSSSRLSLSIPFTLISLRLSGSIPEGNFILLRKSNPDLYASALSLTAFCVLFNSPITQLYFEGS